MLHHCDPFWPLSLWYSRSLLLLMFWCLCISYHCSIMKITIFFKYSLFLLFLIHKALFLHHSYHIHYQNSNCSHLITVNKPTKSLMSLFQDSGWHTRTFYDFSWSNDKTSSTIEIKSVKQWYFFMKALNIFSFKHSGLISARTMVRTLGKRWKETLWGQ